MIGAIYGDIVGSVYEFDNAKSADFPLLTKASDFTDDSVLTVATMDVLLSNGNYTERYRHWYAEYPDAGYGFRFYQWARKENLEPYNSWGNGSAMRVSPIGFWFDSIEETRAEARRSAAGTHNHPEGIKGAESTAAAIFLARQHASKDEIKAYITNEFGYDLTESIESIRTWYKFDESCKGTVPQSIICFLESTNFEDAIRKAIYIGGDSDTIACIVGGIAEAYYGITQDIRETVMEYLTEELGEVVEEFYRRINM